VVQVDAEGRTERRNVARRTILRETGVAGRDLRRVDPSLHVTTSNPSIVVSGRALLINLAGVRLVTKGTFCFLLDPDSAPASNFLDALLSRLAAAKGARLMAGITGSSCAVADTAAAVAAAATPCDENSTAHVMDDGEEELRSSPSAAAAAVAAARATVPNDCSGASTAHDVVSENREDGSVPFEMEVLEAALLEATAQQDARMLDITRKVSNLHSELQTRLSPVLLEELRSTKQALVELDSRSGAFRETLVELLDDHEELRELHVGLPAAEDQAELERRGEEAENLLEYYLQRCDSCHSEAERMLQNLRDLEESISVTLSARRYEVSKLELLISISTVALTVGGLITGIFGMNLKSTFEDSIVAFYLTTFLIFSGSAAIFGALFRRVRQLGVL
jgi:magnesium transporter